MIETKNILEIIRCGLMLLRDNNEITQQEMVQLIRRVESAVETSILKMPAEVINNG